jgi:hypothetical protein
MSIWCALRAVLSGKEISMARDEKQNKVPDQQEPDGFTPGTQGEAGKAAREEGWGLNEEERRKPPQGHHPEFGGKDYDYGAQDFGDTPSRSGADAERDLEKSDEKKKAS